MRFVRIVFLLQACGVILAADKESAPDLPGTKYPPIVGFFNCIELHTNAVRNLQQTNFLVVTEFYRMDGLGGDMLRYIVKENGHMTNGVDDGSGALEDPQHKQLSKATMERLQSILNRLPGTNQYGWLESLASIWPETPDFGSGARR